MADQPTPSPEELILAMLRDVLARQARQMGLKTTEPPAPPPSPTPDVAAALPTIPVPEPEPPTPDAAAAPSAPDSKPQPHTPHAATVASPSPEPTQPPDHSTADARLSDYSTTRPTPGSEFEPEPEPLSKAELAQLAELDELAAQSLVPGPLPRTLRLFVVGLFAILILINLPLFNGSALARALPDRQALIIRDGLVLKGSGPEIYVLENNHKRWISSLDAFEYYGYKWDDVHIVDDAFLNQFPDGKPIHVLLKCTDSPHIYRLENDRKRWIKDIPTFTAEGHVWEDVRFISCARLRSIPDGPPIPPDAGPPPQP